MNLFTAMMIPFLWLALMILFFGILLKVITVRSKAEAERIGPGVLQLASLFLTEVRPPETDWPALVGSVRAVGKFGSDIVTVGQTRAVKNSPEKLLIQKSSVMSSEFLLNSRKLGGSGISPYLIGLRKAAAVTIEGGDVYADGEGTLVLTGPQKSALESLCRVETFERCKNNPTTDGLKIVFQSELLKNETDFNAAVTTIKSTLSVF